jgi:hypothetical protein
LKPIEIVAADDPRMSIMFTVPVKGRKPVTLSVPRFDCIDIEELDAITKSINALDDDKELTNNGKQRMGALLTLKPFVTDSIYSALETLKIVELNQIIAAWTENSQMALPEFLASAAISTVSTVRPSTTTSEPSGVSEDTTSGAA